MSLMPINFRVIGGCGTYEFHCDKRMVIVAVSDELKVFRLFCESEESHKSMAGDTGTTISRLSDIWQPMMERVAAFMMSQTCVLRSCTFI